MQPIPDTALEPRAALAEAERLLAAGRPFAAHEVLEAVWKATSVDRDRWRGLAQLAVGLTHSQRGNAVGAVRLLRRAAERLAPYDDLAAPRASALEWAGRIEGAGPADLDAVQSDVAAEGRTLRLAQSERRR